MAGRLLRRYVGRTEYRATQQNWDATQDSSGVLYVANTEGVLTYDGHAWRTLSVGGVGRVNVLASDAATQAIPVIMVTARAGTGDEVKGLQVGGDDYIAKPFDAGVLRQRVGGVIVLQERLRERLRVEAATESTDPAEARSEVEQEARRVIREHLGEPDFDVSALASEMAMSRSSLYRAFDDETDTTPSAHITEVRMERARLLLRNDEGTVTQVAYAVGFDQLSSFSRAFREYAGHPPSAVGA